MTAQTVWLPMSSRPVSQQPSRKNPVIGLIEQTSSRSPSTLRGVLDRPTPLPLSSLSIAVSACGVVDRLLIFGESHLRLPTRFSGSRAHPITSSPRGEPGADGHLGSPARRNPSSNRERPSACQGPTTSLRVETRSAGLSCRGRAIALCACSSRPAIALLAAAIRNPG